VVRGQAEIVSTMILLGIALIAGYMVYRSFYLQMQQQAVGVQAATEIARQRIGERFTIVEGYIRVVNSTYKEVVIVIYNDGDIDVTFTKIRVPAIGEGGDLILLSFELSKTIRKGDVGVIKLGISDPSVSYPPGIAVKVFAETSSKRIYSFELITVKG